MSASTQADEITHEPPSKRVRVSNASTTYPATPLQCQVCHRSYERADHLNRHLDSHRNQRLFRCEQCPAAFNRKDLLLRHQATHAKLAAEGEVGQNRTVERTTKACDACVISKVKCDNSRPCRRCQKKQLECTTQVDGRSSSFVVSEGQGQSHADVTPSPQVHPQFTDVPSREQIQANQIIPDGAFVGISDDTQDSLSWYQNAANQDYGMHSFFEQIMVSEPDFPGTEFFPIPPDLNSRLPEIDWFGDVDIFGSDFAPAIDETFQTPADNTDAGSVEITTTTTPRGTTITTARDTNSSEARKKRHAVFKQSSPWFWIPERHQNAFSDQQGITLDERQLDLASSPHQPHSSDVIIPGSLSQQARDRIFQLVSRTAHGRISIPSFPSADCLDKLLQVGIAKRAETDAWIHPYTFDRESSRPEFLTALVVAGCICFGIPSVNKTGLVLHEIVRLSLRDLFERDNSALLELQYSQASMLWLDIGAFCGFRQKMQIAESSLQTLVTTLRREGRFDGVRYPKIIPTMEDSDNDLDKKWREWVHLESFKRLVYHLLDHDMYMTMVNHRQPLISYAELTVPFPASRPLWFAPSAEVWRARMLTTAAVDTPQSLRSILQNEHSILRLLSAVDAHVVRSSYLHGQAAQIWEYNQQSVLNQECNDPVSQLWVRSRQQRLYQSLQHTNFSPQNSPPITCVFYHFLQMYLHVDLDAVTRFAGRCGEEAAHRAYITLQAWSQTKEARIAISHAGLVVHSARQIPPYQNRGQDSLIIYHAIMVLWTYSMMQCDQAKKSRTGTNTPMHSHQPSINISDTETISGDTQNARAQSLEGTLVFLDEAHNTNRDAIDAFILMKVGTPCLHITTKQGYQGNIEGRSASTNANLNTNNPNGPSTNLESCNLNVPSQVMKVGVSLFEGTHPDVDREHAPPLLRALCGLMEELGGLR